MLALSCEAGVLRTCPLSEGEPACDPEQQEEYGCHRPIPEALPSPHVVFEGTALRHEYRRCPPRVLWAERGAVADALRLFSLGDNARLVLPQPTERAVTMLALIRAIRLANENVAAEEARAKAAAGSGSGR